MAAMTYAEFGLHLGQQSPYSAPGDVTFDPGFDDISQGVTKVATSETGPFDTHWLWRHARPWKDEPVRPGRPARPHKVHSYEITKALLIPYTYQRKLSSMFGGTIVPTNGAGTPFDGPCELQVSIKGHLLVGYTGPLPRRPRSAEDAATTGTPGYPELGELIRNQTPMADPSAGILPELLDAAVDAPASHASADQHLEVAETWLAGISHAKAKDGLCALESNSDMEMDLFQEQQCLYWGFPLEVGTPQVWLRYFQVTKAFRAAYKITAPDPSRRGAVTTFRGHVLCGLTGAGDM